MIKKYLVVLDFPNGISDISGIAVFEAKTEIEARISACDIWGLSDSAITDMKCYLVDDLRNGWSYF